MEHKAEVNIVEDILIIDKLHQCFSHIALAAVKKLIQDRLITDLKLDGNKEVDIFYKSCVYAKVTQLL